MTPLNQVFADALPVDLSPPRSAPGNLRAQAHSAQAQRRVGPVEALVGTSLGAFRIIRELPPGGLGSVYLAEHVRTRSQVAIKLLHPELAADPSLVTRFHAEARTVSLIAHENVASVLDIGVLPTGQPYLMREHLEGQPLSALRGPLPVELLAMILAQVCDALTAAHCHQLVHRDLRPDNIFLIRHAGTEHFVKLLDFGVPRLGPGMLGTGASPGCLLGTPEYMAPEQGLSPRVDPRSDLYSLGVIAFLLATGRLPFSGSGLDVMVAHREQLPPSPRALRPELSEALEDVLLRALAKRPSERFQTAAAFKEALLSAVGSGAEAAGTVATRAPPRHERALECCFQDSTGFGQMTLRCVRLSRGGLFACTAGLLPPLLGRMRLTTLLEGQERVCEVEVVRHVRPAEAGVWGLPAGFGVRFVDAPAGLKDAISRLLSGLRPGEPVPVAVAGDDAIAAPVLEEFLARDPADPHAVLGVGRDRPRAELHQRGREERRRLERLRARPLSRTQQRRLALCLDHLDAALAATWRLGG